MQIHVSHNRQFSHRVNSVKPCSHYRHLRIFRAHGMISHLGNEMHSISIKEIHVGRQAEVPTALLINYCTKQHASIYHLQNCYVPHTGVSVQFPICQSYTDPSFLPSFAFVINVCWLRINKSLTTIFKICKKQIKPKLEFLSRQH